MSAAHSDCSGIHAVLRAATGASDARDWLIDDPVQGVQATVYKVRLLRPVIWDQHHRIVVKLYRSRPAPTSGLPDREFELLARMRAVLNGRRIDGWNVFTPTPFRALQSPPALIMSMVPGTRLSSWLEQPAVPDGIFRSLPRALVSALSEFWSRGELHGDLTFDNILCDLSTHSFSLVDPGLRTICTLKNHDGDVCSASSHDLAHTLYDVLISTLDRTCHPITYGRKWLFIRALVCAFAELSGASAATMLDELQNCVRLHLMALQGDSARWDLRSALQMRIGLWRLSKLQTFHTAPLAWRKAI